MNTRVLIIGFVLLLAACTAPQASPTSAPQAGLPNPASVYCVEQGFTSEIRTAADGSQSGVCIFADGSECDEWAYLRGECAPGNAIRTPEAEPPAAEVEFASDGCKIYRNEKFGYSFHYPADASIVSNDEPLGSITVSGPLVEGESWPQFTVSHPSEREDYRPPEDADLEAWLVEHSLLADERQPDVQIAGTTAIHARHERSPQSYAYDRYFFARSGQLYMIVIGHTADKEDWELYNHFLESFQFEK